MTKLIIQKFGGTSVADLSRMQRVAMLALTAKAAGHRVVIVVSAMSGETDRLINLARQIDVNPDIREYSALIATGEQVSAALVAMTLQKQGCAARSYTGWQTGIQTDSVLDKARIVDIEAQLLQRDLEKGIIPVITGFQGVDHNNNISTLGRGGSDTTAVALAAVLKADECQIYTDVEGVYTADPRVVPEARRLDHITFAEMLELASLGAKVLQLRSVEFAWKYKVPLRVLSTFVDGPGTLITFEEKTVEKPLISGIAFHRQQAKLTIRGLPDHVAVLARIISALSDANIEIDMMVQNTVAESKLSLTFATHRDHYAKAKDVLTQVSAEFDSVEVLGVADVAKLSLVGVGMCSHGSVASQLFETLASEGIHVQLVSTSEIKISVIIEEAFAEQGARALHRVFELG